MTNFEILVIVMLIAILFLLLKIFISDDSGELVAELGKQFQNQHQQARNEILQTLQTLFKGNIDTVNSSVDRASEKTLVTLEKMGQLIDKNLETKATAQQTALNANRESVDKLSASQEKAMSNFENLITAQLEKLEERVKSVEDSNESRMTKVEQALVASVKDLQGTNVETLANVGVDVSRKLTETATTLEKIVQALQTSIGARLEGMEKANARATAEIRIMVEDKLQAVNNNVNNNIGMFKDAHVESIEAFNQSVKQQIDRVVESSENQRKTVANGMETMRADNRRELQEMREIVDQKLTEALQKSVSESFRQVQGQLEMVQRGLGEMQELAKDVGQLSKVMGNVKTRGIVGEEQLGAILQEFLSEAQYEKNYRPAKGSKDAVEYAVRMPVGDGIQVMLPIDSKLPGDTYLKVQEAKESCDKTLIEAAFKELETRIKSEAKDIHDKYIKPPTTTEYAILFLPFEGLYADVVSRGMREKLFEDYRVQIAGPSTLSVMLTTIQLGYRAVAIQKNSAQVWQILKAAKTEFGKFEEGLIKIKGSLEKSTATVDELLTTRTKKITSSLRDVETIEYTDAQALLGMDGNGTVEN